MGLKDIIGINKGSIISIVGAGGKTSLMYSLSEELGHDYKILLTTTTKIYLPDDEKYDFLVIDDEEFDCCGCNDHKGIYVYGRYVNEENKIVGLTKEVLDKQIQNFDYILVEADGSKGRPVKGWRDNEPVVSLKTEKTVGVLSIEVLGKKINEDTVYRVDEFTDVTSSSRGEAITIEHMASLILHPKGLFKDSAGERILFINKVEDTKNTVIAYRLISSILEKNSSYIDKIIIGSLKNKSYRLVYTKFKGDKN